ncbi:MAG: hypothetical protein WBY53_19890 [Acidobacteriaceae bacterium]
MPRQEVFFEQMIGDRRVEILKVYDRQVAREAFDSMDEPAQAFLWNSLRPEETYDSAGLPTADEPEDRTAFLWDELEEQAREDWKTFSYFVVYEAQGGRAEGLYVSPDWPSAEEFAKLHIAGIA